MSRRVTVVGDGAWGTALALILRARGCAVTLWGAFPADLDEIRRRGENARFLPGVALPADLRLCGDDRQALDGAEIVVLAVPTRFFRAVVTRLAPLIPRAARVVSVAKGFDPESHERISAVACRLLDRPDVAVLSGPSHAEEVARGIPTAVTIACADAAAATDLQALFGGGHFRVYTSPDVAGVELGGALKNVLAIAVGVSDGLGFGDNTRAALITRGLLEMTRLGCALGARRETFAGLSGLGDLIVTCTSRHSRNRAFGEALGKGRTAAEILGETRQAVEGAWNCGVAMAWATKYGIEVPIMAEVDALIRGTKHAREAVEALLARDFKPEHD